MQRKRHAGKRSAARRAGLAGMRRSLLREAHAQLKPAYRAHPFSTHSIDALHNEYLQLLAPEAKDLGLLVSIMLGVLPENDLKMLRKVKRETLIDDLKVLGIRSKRRKRQRG